MAPAAHAACEPAIDLAHTVYFLRHGETQWNFERRLQGQSDIALNDTGRAQAARHGEVMAGLSEDWASFRFAVSPLVRCRETFEIVRDRLAIDVEPEFDERLREGQFGRWEGWTWEEIQTREPDNHDIWIAQAWTTAPHGGETYGDIARRFADWAASIDGPTVIVSHGGVSRVLRALYENLEKRNLVEMSVSQKRFMRLSGGTVEFI